MFSAHTVIRMLTRTQLRKSAFFFTLPLCFSCYKCAVAQELIKVARFYYDFQDTNAIIVEMEAIAAVDLDGLRNVAVL